MNIIIIFKSDFIDNSKRIRLSGRRFEHISSFLGVKTGEIVQTGLLNGKIGTGLITSLPDKSIEMEVDFTKPPPPALPVHLIMAMPRPKALKRIIQHITAMGVKKISIIKTWRVEKSYLDSPVLNENSLFQQMIMGLEQGKDTILPEIHIKKLFKPFVEDEIPEIIKGTHAIVAHPGSKNECPRNIQKPVTLVIGAEGGFIPYEIELLEKHGFEVIHIGERILRVETVIPALLGRLF